MDLFDLYAKVILDTQDYEKNVKSSKETGESLADALKKVSGDSKTTSDKIKVLATQHKNAEEEVKKLTEAFNKSAKEKGTDSKETQELAEKLKKAESNAETLKREIDGLSNEVDDLGNETKQTSGTMNDFAGNLKSAIGSVATVVTGVLASVTAGIIALGKVGLEYNAQMESYTTNFEVMLGSAEKAATKVEELKVLSAKTPFEMGDLASATQTLLAFNVSAEESTGILQMLGDISLGNAQKLESLTRAYGKMNSSQKVTLEDINMMIDAGFNPLLLVSENTGESMEELYKRISDGEVAFSEIQDAMKQATSEGGQFYQGMEKASQTLEGLTSTLKDNAQAFVGSLFKPLSDFASSEALPKVIGWMERLQEAFDKDGMAGVFDTGADIITELMNGISEKSPELLEKGYTISEKILQGIVSKLPEMITAGSNMLMSIISGYSSKIPELMPQIAELYFQIFSALTDPTALETMLNAAFILLNALADGWLNEMPVLIDRVPTLIESIIETISKLLPKIFETAAQIIITLILGITEKLPEIIEAAGRIVTSLITGIINMRGEFQQAAFRLMQFFIDKAKEIDWEKLGKDIIDSIISGFKDMWENIKQASLDTGEKVIDTLKSLDWFKAGKDVITEVVNGILSMISNVKDAALNIAKTAYDTVAGFFQNNSISNLIRGEVSSNNTLNSGSAKTSSVSFSESSLGKSSAGIVNGIIAGSQSSKSTQNINLVVDGKTLANVVFDPLNNISKQRGVALGNA